MPQLLKELDLPCLLSVSLWRWKKPICGLGSGFKCHRFENMNTGRKEPWVIYCNTRSGERQFYNIQTKSGRLPSIHTLLLIEPRFCSGMSMCVTHNRSIHTHTHTQRERDTCKVHEPQETITRPYLQGSGLAGIRVIPSLLSDWFRKECMTHIRSMREEEQLTGVSGIDLGPSSEKASRKDFLFPLDIVIQKR